jgi:hypothetical protein
VRGLALRLLFASAFILGTASLLDAQQPKWKIGDRVETDIIQPSDPSRAIWEKGTVTVVDLRVMAYGIQLDPVPGQLSRMQTVPIRPYAEGWIRAAGGADKGAPQVPVDKLLIDRNNTVLADRALLDCASVVQNQPRAQNGAPLPVELAKKLIRCLYEKPSGIGSDGATKMDISGFVPGAPHKWNPYSDLGPGGTINTFVYPIRVTWTEKTFYRSYNQVLVNREQMFTCFVNIDKWACGQAQLVREGLKTQIQVR